MEQQRSYFTALDYVLGEMELDLSDHNTALTTVLKILDPEGKT